MRILLIDDDLSCLNALQRALEKVNYECFSYQDPVKGVAVYKANHFDVVITDISMPKMNGLDVLRSVKESNSAVRVIMMTGYAHIDSAQAALNQGAYAYFRKPYNLSNLIEILQKIEKELNTERDIKGKIHKFEETRDELNLTYEHLQYHVVALDQVHAISRKIHAAIDLNDIMHEMLNGASHLLDCEYCLIAFKEKSLRQCHCYFGKGLIRNRLCGDGSCILETPPFEQCLNKQKVFLDNNPPGEIKEIMQAKAIGLKNYVCVPLIHNGRALGVLAGLNKKTGFTGNDKFLTNILGGTAVTAIHNAELIGQLKEFFEQTVEALARGIDARDKYTRGHTSRVSNYIIAIGRGLGWDKGKLDEAYIGSVLHDIGKIGIPDRILNKPGRLTKEEFRLMKDHVSIGVDILKDVPQLKGMLGYIHCHHERLDGFGYPRGLKGNDIPIEGRIVCIADSFDAMTSNRSYRSSLSVDQAVAELERCAGSQFDPEIVEVFVSLIRSKKIEVNSEIACQKEKVSGF
jgi:response regulator RpfG family c-di-GMP phosphodiesterase